jgi:hypothetical protein
MSDRRIQILIKNRNITENKSLKEKFIEEHI